MATKIKAKILFMKSTFQEKALFLLHSDKIPQCYQYLKSIELKYYNTRQA